MSFGYINHFHVLQIPSHRETKVALLAKGRETVPLTTLERLKDILEKSEIKTTVALPKEFQRMIEFCDNPWNLYDILEILNGHELKNVDGTFWFPYLWSL